MSEDTNRYDLNRFLNRKLNRRSFLGKLKKLAGVITGIGFTGAIPWLSSGKSRNTQKVAPLLKTATKTLVYPFKMGVASGDPVQDGVVLWTRLAPDPLNGGGMQTERVEVRWEVALDESFQKIVKQGIATAVHDNAHSVHVEVDGLEPNRWYYYRFKSGTDISQTGRTKTAPEPGAYLDRLNFAFVSCQNYSDGYYSAYDHLIKEELDVVLFLGDYIYEYGSQGDIGRGHIPRKEIFSLEEYRTRHAQYKCDPSLQAAHAAFPWIVSLDDHEVKNDWGGEGPPYKDNEQFLARRAAAFQAFYEHMPLRKRSIPDDMGMQLYRRFKYGNLADFNVLDTRQYRTDFACGGGNQSQCQERFDPSRTILGRRQEQWLFNNLKSSSARWNILAQQVMMARRDRSAGPDVRMHMDKWDGYAASRNRLFNVIEKNNISNLVVLTGDQHSNWVNDLKKDFNDVDSSTIATEFVGTSITSGGNGVDLGKKGKIALDENPHVNFFNSQRGYVRCTLTQQKWRTDFRIIPYVDKAGAPIKTRASFVVENGKAGAVRV